jgi:hypothetical protein
VGDDLGRARQGGSPRTLGRLLAAIFHIRRHDPHLRSRDATNHKKVSRPHRRDRASAAFAVLRPSNICRALWAMQDDDGVPAHFATDCCIVVTVSCGL